MTNTEKSALATRMLAELKTNRLVIWPRTAKDYSFGRIGRYTLSTDRHGDHMFVSEGLEVVELLHTRDFSLYGYNLDDQASRAAAREYVRRKLKAAEDQALEGQE